MDLEGPGEIVIFPERGDFYVGTSGGMFSDGSVEFFDFVGNKIPSAFFEAFKRFTSAEDLVSGHRKSRHEGEIFPFEKSLRFMYINHIRMQPVSKDQVKFGVFLNLGTNEKPFVLAPFFTSSAFTACAALDELPDVLLKGLRVAAGKFRGTWRKFLLSENG